MKTNTANVSLTVQSTSSGRDSGVQSGGDERGDGSGHPMSEITKIKMLQLVNFSYCKITNARCMHLGVGRNFLHGGVNSGFSRGSQKDFAGVGQHDRISF